MKNYAPFISAVVMLSWAALSPNCAVVGGANRSFVHKTPAGESRVMGVDVHVHLFDIRTYREKVLPAYQAFLRRDDPEPLISLLRECIKELDSNPHLSEKLLWNKEAVEDDIRVLTGAINDRPDANTSSIQAERKETHKARRDFARRQLGSYILEVLCVPRNKGVIPEQDMTNSPLVSYLYGKSGLIKDLFTFARPVRGGRLELPLGESAQLFSEKDIQELRSELDKISPPETPEIRKEYDNLRALLHLASEETDLRLILSTS